MDLKDRDILSLMSDKNTIKGNNEMREDENK